MTTQRTDPGMQRREFLKQIAVVSGGIMLNRVSLKSQTSNTLPDPLSSGIEHIVFVMMENRSFDHYFGWLQGADGKQAGLSYVDSSGQSHSTHHLSDFQGCGHHDPDHSFVGGRVELNNGACDGWLRAGQNDTYAIGYYTQDDLAFFGDSVQHWTVFDRYFSSIMAETFPNRMYQHAAQTDRIANTPDPSVLPTIWDQLSVHGITGRYYYSDVPFLALWGFKYLSISSLFPSFLQDCAAGTLPQVSFVEPRFLGAEAGLSGDDHPFADIRAGQAFLNQVYKAVTKSPLWRSTVLVIAYDEWGGFFEHVPPPNGVPDVQPAVGSLLGFRVPALLISPWSRRTPVSHTVFEHTSVLKMIEWRWGLPSLTVRDAATNNIVEAIDFSKPKKNAPEYNVPVGPFGQPCPSVARFAPNKWDLLKTVAEDHGWPIGAAV